MSAATAASAGARAQGAEAPARLERGLALGWLTLLPLVLAYELALRAAPAGPRNAAEYLITLPFAAALPRPDLARAVLELVATGAAVWSVFHAELGLARRLLRAVLEGLAAAAVLGPVLLVLLHALDVAAPAGSRPGGVLGLADASLLVGGAAFEELVFRVALLAALVPLASGTFEWLLGAERPARWLGEAAALGAGAFVFAAAHLAPVVSLMAPGGEPWDGARFAWRCAAGLLLAVLYRWRGIGVAAWAHAFFNLALVLGAGPEVLG